MSQKYEAFDQKLFAWLRDNRRDVTTAKANQALKAEDSTLQRHVSRRFTQLEDRGVLVCHLEGTTRVCTVQKDPPESLAKQRWRPPSNQQDPLPPAHSIEAADSIEFEARGGIIEKLPSQWDKKPSCNAVGIISFDHLLASLD